MTKTAELYETRITELKQLYEARISELQSQVTDLRKLVFAPHDSPIPPALAMEADAIISVKEEPIEISASEMTDFEKREVDLIFSGMHEEELD